MYLEPRRLPPFNQGLGSTIDRFASIHIRKMVAALEPSIHQMEISISASPSPSQAWMLTIEPKLVEAADRAQLPAVAGKHVGGLDVEGG